MGVGPSRPPVIHCMSGISKVVAYSWVTATGLKLWSSHPMGVAPSLPRGTKQCGSGIWIRSERYAHSKVIRVCHDRGGDTQRTRALSGSYDETLGLWDLESGQTLRK